MVAQLRPPMDQGGKPAASQIHHDRDALGSQGNAYVYTFRHLRPPA
jgi:hypothetical protein